MILLAAFIKSEFLSFVFRSHRVLETASATDFGTTEFSISVSPRFRKLPHFEQVGDTEFYFGFIELGNNVVTVGFLEMPIYTPPPPFTRKGSTQNKPTLPMSKFLRENHLVLCCGQDCWKYALEAIINWLLLYFLVHDNCLLSML